MYETPRDSIDQIDAMRMGVDYHFKISCRKFDLICRPLSISENLDVISKVAHRLSQMSEFEKNRLAEHTLYAIETLILSSTTEQGSNDPKITEYILQRVTPSEIDYLFKQYVGHIEKVSPALERLDQAQVTALVEDLKKKATPLDLDSQLTELSYLQLVNVCRFLIIPN